MTMPTPQWKWGDPVPGPVQEPVTPPGEPLPFNFEVEDDDDPAEAS